MGAQRLKPGVRALARIWITGNFHHMGLDRTFSADRRLLGRAAALGREVYVSGAGTGYFIG
jgi:hypothetical protein